MKALKIEITRLIDSSYPGFVEARFEDAWGKEHIVIDKVPVIALEDLDENSKYPSAGIIACEIMKIWKDGIDRTIVSVSTEKPWYIDSVENLTEFDLLEEQLIEFTPIFR